MDEDPALDNMPPLSEATVGDFAEHLENITVADSATGGPSKKTWFFTVFYQLASMTSAVMLAILADPGISYMIVSRLEKCPTTDRLHRHGCVTFKKARRFANVKKLYKSCNIGVARNCDAAQVYCAKLETAVDPTEQPLIIDNRVGRGHRTDLDEFTALIDTGASNLALRTAHSSLFLRYSSNLPRYRAAACSHRTRKTLGVYLYGAHSIGKTRGLMLAFPDADFPVYDGKFFGGIHGRSRVAIFNDPDLTFFSAAIVKKMLDRDKWDARVLGSHICWPYELVFFVVNHEPETWAAWADPAVRSRFRDRRGITVHWTTCDVVPRLPRWARGDGEFKLTPGITLPSEEADDRNPGHESDSGLDD